MTHSVVESTPSANRMISETTTPLNPIPNSTPGAPRVGVSSAEARGIRSEHPFGVEEALPTRPFFSRPFQPDTSLAAHVDEGNLLY